MAEEAGLGKGRCAYMDKVLPVVLMGLQSWRVRRLAKGEFGLDIGDREGFYRWLGMNQRFHSMNETNTLAL